MRNPKHLKIVLACLLATSVQLTFAQATRTNLDKAKTVAQLLELDDKLAIAKEESALAKERESMPKALPMLAEVKKPVVKQKGGNEGKPVVVPEQVNVIGIVGLDGQRMVNIKVDEKDYQLAEGSNNSGGSGWKVVKISGSCVTLAKDGVSANKSVCYTGNKAPAPLLQAPLPMPSSGSAFPIPPIPQVAQRK